jgi:hypothetical protein
MFLPLSGTGVLLTAEAMSHPRLLMAMAVACRPGRPPAARPRVRVRIDAIPGLSDQQLLLHWRISYAALQAGCLRADLPAVVEFRSHCLDELERRHPQGFARWMRSTPGPSGDPTPFVLAKR